MASDFVVRLPDSRRLGCREYGPSGGSPIFYFHGWPCSRFEAQLLEPDAAALGARILAVDRPGHGLSDFQPGRRLLDWPGDVTTLADRLGLGRFCVVGVSGGGPYAAVCAWALPDRVQRASLVSSLAPISDSKQLKRMHLGNRTLLSLARVMPQLGPLLLAPFGWTLRHGLPPLMARLFAAGFAEVDQRALRRPEVARTIYESTLEAFRNGARGPAWEGRIYPRAWGFELGEIGVPVDIWHGSADRNVPEAMARYLHQSIQASRLHLYPEEGHLSLPYRHKREILAVLLEPPAGLN